MLVKEQVMEKVQILPENILREVDDFSIFWRLKERRKKSDGSGYQEP